MKKIKNYSTMRYGIYAQTAKLGLIDVGTFMNVHTVNIK
jgi:hypothetical protein